jgi:D-serine deaminase-like pyridoxal phosphate-dependent protein
VTVDPIPTPYIAIDAGIVQQNIEGMAAYARTHGLKLRPHIKTHKSLHLAALQLEAGAVGLTVAKPGEAEVMSRLADDILMAYPAVQPERCALLATLAHETTIRVAVDSLFAAGVLSGAASANRSTIGILVDLDVGLGRTGVQSPADALQLAQQVDTLPGLRLDGLLCYPGHVKEPAEAQPDILSGIDRLLGETMGLWAASGLEAGIVSGGSTPTAYQSHLVARLTEIRPGTYIFNDMNTVRGGYASLDECAAFVVSTVVSDAVPGQVVVDAGSKTLTSDLCGPAPDSGYGYVVEYPEARITRLTEEHGQIDLSRYSVRPRVGDRLTIVPNHICPCINLQDRVYWTRSGEPVEPLEVDARGRVY